jgi:hypothetical protein
MWHRRHLLVLVFCVLVSAAHGLSVLQWSRKAAVQSALSGHAASLASVPAALTGAKPVKVEFYAEALCPFCQVLPPLSSSLRQSALLITPAKL